MFSVLTAISTGGLYVPAVYIVFYVAFIFWLLLLNRSCSADPSKPVLLNRSFDPLANP